MDVETLLEKIRKAQRPCENMRIEWTVERGAGGAWGGSERKQIRVTKWKDRLILSGVRSRMEQRQETYYAKDANEPNLVSDTTYVFDGTVRRNLEKHTKGFRTPGSRGVMWLCDFSFLIRQMLFGNVNMLYDEQRLKDYELSLSKSDVPGVYVLDVHPYRQEHYRFTIDGNRGYNIVKIESLDSNVKRYEYNFKLKQHSDNTWFVSEREGIRFSQGGKTRAEEKATVTNVEFDTPKPAREMFKLPFLKGTPVADFTFDHSDCTNFVAGLLSEAKYTEENPEVSAILRDETGTENQNGDHEIFGAIKESLINSIGHRKKCFIDFDTGMLLSVPSGFHLNSEPQKWFGQNSVDARVETDEGLCGLWTFRTVVIPVTNERWDSITPEGCRRVFDKVKGIDPPIMSAQGRLPATFLFQTWDNRGILQILEVQRDKEPRSIKVHYKMIKEAQDVEG
ncbi:MAG: hypothetical protein ACYTBJ_19420 [Planctomycetota bacterium]|jgi:hypothetical protein